MNTVQRLLLLGCTPLCIAWTDGLRGRVVEGNRLFSEGHFSEAVESYGQALVDHPDSPVLNFNMGTAHYKAGKYTQALSSFSRVQANSADSDMDSGRAARTAYNRGNAQYKMGARSEEQNPQAALTAYTDALASYRRALGTDPTDQDAKFNYEFVAKRIEALQEKLENQPQPNQPGQPNRPEREEQRQSEQEDDGQRQPDAQQDGQGRKHAGEQPRESSRVEQGQDQPNEMSEDEAQSVVDAARNEELSPEEFARQAQRGDMAEPLRDW